MKKRLEGLITIAKDFVILLRDSAIILLAVLLILFPNTFNSIMVNAGFQEGSIGGFKWKSNLVESNEALEQANKSIESLKEENDLLVLALEEAKINLGDSDLNKKFNILRDKNISLKKETDAVQKGVLQVIESNEPVLKKINFESKRNRTLKVSDYSVGLQTLGIQNEARLELNKKIIKNGYELDDFTYSYNADNKPNWLALSPTVFYYSNSSKKQAEDLSQLMEKLTEKKFAVRRGECAGVDQSRKHLTNFVHYIE
jgi:hypothetical protein